MFIKIDSNNIFIGAVSDSHIDVIKKPFFLNTHMLIQIEFDECLIDKIFLRDNIKLENLIRLYVLVDDGIWNFMTLYFTESSHGEFQRIKRLIAEKGK